MQDNCVHGENSSFSYMMQNSDSSISRKGKEIAVAVESVSFNGTYNSVGGNEQSLMSMNNFPLNQNLLIPEGRVHGGGLMAMLRENLVSFEPFAGSQTRSTWFHRCRRTSLSRIDESPTSFGSSCLSPHEHSSSTSLIPVSNGYVCFCC